MVRGEVPSSFRTEGNGVKVGSFQSQITDQSLVACSKLVKIGKLSSKLNGRGSKIVVL